MTDGSPADEWLGHGAHLDGRDDARDAQMAHELHEQEVVLVGGERRGDGGDLTPLERLQGGGGLRDRLGLEVLVVEDHLTPIVTVEIAVKNGSFTESPTYSGLSHLYEHMFFTANARDSSEDEFLGRVDDLGIVYNGETHEELVEYYFTLPKENFEAGLDFMSVAIRSPLFRSDEFRKQQAVVLGEFDRNEALPLFSFGRKMERALWGSLISRKQPLGRRETITAATREQMLTIKDKYYIPNNSLLIITGDVDTDQVRALERLGAEHALVVYGQDGLDEVSLGAATLVGELKNGKVTEYDIHPEDFGFAMSSNRALRVETPEQSRAMVFANTPILSSVLLSGATPELSTQPTVNLKPVMPQ